MQNRIQLVLHAEQTTPVCPATPGPGEAGRAFRSSCFVACPFSWLAATNSRFPFEVQKLTPVNFTIAGRRSTFITLIFIHTKETTTNETEADIYKA